MFEFLQTNNKSLKVAALTDYKKIIVFDIQTKSAKVITAVNVKVSELAEAVAVAPSGDSIVITGTKSFKIYDEVTEETLGYIWNSKTGTSLVNNV